MTDNPNLDITRIAAAQMVEVFLEYSDVDGSISDEGLTLLQHMFHTASEVLRAQLFETFIEELDKQEVVYDKEEFQHSPKDIAERLVH